MDEFEYPATCRKCGYSWKYRGMKRPMPNRKIYIVCPRCHFATAMEVTA